VFNITSHKGNANQNNTEISSHSNHNGYYQENRLMLVILVSLEAENCGSRPAWTKSSQDPVSTDRS
jgi:hypothetical protein